MMAWKPWMKLICDMGFSQGRKQARILQCREEAPKSK